MKENAKCFILTVSGYEEITYTILTERIESDPSYKSRRFIPMHGMLLEVQEKDYKEFYRAIRRQKYLQEESVRVNEVSYNALDTDEMSGEETIVDPSPLPDAVVVDRLMLETLRLCMDRLNERDRDLLTALYFDGKTEREVSEETGIPQKTLNDRRHRALERLREIMKK